MKNQKIHIAPILLRIAKLTALFVPQRRKCRDSRDFITPQGLILTS